MLTPQFDAVNFTCRGNYSVVYGTPPTHVSDSITSNAMERICLQNSATATCALRKHGIGTLTFGLLKVRGPDLIDLTCHLDDMSSKYSAVLLLRNYS